MNKTTFCVARRSADRPTELFRLRHGTSCHFFLLRGGSAAAEATALKPSPPTCHGSDTTMALRPRHRSWTAEETGRLRMHIERGGSAARAAVMFHRTQGAVRAHAAACGLKFPTISELRRKAAGDAARFDGHLPGSARNE
jgi:hypothetical protein